MMLNKDASALLLVDVQEKLTPLVLQSESLIKHCHWLIRLANDLDVPVMTSEQYPSGLKPTIKELRDLVSENLLVEKTHFSCYPDPAFIKTWSSLKKSQIVLAGIETHICVLQTALDLCEAGVEVFVVVDAVSARHEIDHKYGLKRMKQNGVHLITSEMVFFEWLRKAGTPQFKAMSQAYLR